MNTEVIDTIKQELMIEGTENCFLDSVFNIFNIVIKFSNTRKSKHADKLVSSVVSPVSQVYPVYPVSPVSQVSLVSLVSLVSPAPLVSPVSPVSLVSL